MAARVKSLPKCGFVITPHIAMAFVCNLLFLYLLVFAGLQINSEFQNLNRRGENVAQWAAP